MQSCTVSKTETVEEVWLTKKQAFWLKIRLGVSVERVGKPGCEFNEWIVNQALATWDEEELVERVRTGSIIARRCPADRKFWEFKKTTQSDKVMSQREPWI